MLPKKQENQLKSTINILRQQLSWPTDVIDCCAATRNNVFEEFRYSHLSKKKVFGNYNCCNYMFLFPIQIYKLKEIKLLVV